MNVQTLVLAQKGHIGSTETLYNYINDYLTASSSFLKGSRFQNTIRFNPHLSFDDIVQDVLIKAYKKVDGKTSIWTTESFTAIDAAITTGKAIYS